MSRNVYLCTETISKRLDACKLQIEQKNSYSIIVPPILYFCTGFMPRQDYKLLITTFKVMHEMAQVYVSDLIQK